MLQQVTNACRSCHNNPLLDLVRTCFLYEGKNNRIKDKQSICKANSERDSFFLSLSITMCQCAILHMSNLQNSSHDKRITDNNIQICFDNWIIFFGLMTFHDMNNKSIYKLPIIGTTAKGTHQICRPRWQSSSSALARP